MGYTVTEADVYGVYYDLVWNSEPSVEDVDEALKAQFSTFWSIYNYVQLTGGDKHQGCITITFDDTMDLFGMLSFNLRGHTGGSFSVTPFVDFGETRVLLDPITTFTFNSGSWSTSATFQTSEYTPASGIIICGSAVNDGGIYNPININFADNSIWGNMISDPWYWPTDGKPDWWPEDWGDPPGGKWPEEQPPGWVNPPRTSDVPDWWESPWGYIDDSKRRRPRWQPSPLGTMTRHWQSPLGD